ncbi:structural maintenance of chromosomes protein 5-like [Glossina fuscipes fuscipes]
MSNFGKIKSVYCKDFVTYSECIFTPSEYLNVIIGPNGSGKSTLVSAIVLCLGGEPKLLARSNFIRDYVKNGCSSAKISVEVCDERKNKGSLCDEKSVDFTRTFDKNDKSEYFINGHSYSRRDYLEAISKFNIQVNNLCQFLPQDRVQDFAKMNPQEILSNTISSVSNVEILENFKKLKKLQNNQENNQSTHQKLVQKLAESKNRFNELKGELNRFNVRQETEDKLIACNIKKVKIETNELSANLAERTKDCQLAEKLLANFDKENTGIYAKQTEFKNLATQLRLQKEQKEQDFKQAETNKVKILEKIEHIKATINNKRIDFRKRKCEQAEREKDLQNAVQLLEVYVQDLENLKAECSSDSELANAYNQSMECQKVELKRLNQNHTRLNQRLEEFRPEIGSLKKQIESLENVGDQKVLFLQQNFPDVCKAMKWIEENENLFEARVYKPVMLEINVRNPDHSKYLENTIMFRDFQAFSYESKNDMSLLISELCIKRKLTVNIGHAPSDAKFLPVIPIINLRPYGLDAYMIDLIGGPHAVLGYLCSLYRLHNISIGGNEVKEFIEQIPEPITVYFGANVRYNVSISKYSGEKIFSQVQIKCRNILPSIDVPQIEQKKHRLSELGRAIDSLRNQRSSLEAEMREKEVLYKEKKDKLSEIRSRQYELNRKMDEIRKCKERVIDLKNQLKDRVLESDLRRNIAKCLNELLRCQAGRIQALSSLQKAAANKAFLQAKLHVFNTENEALVNQIKTLLENRNSAKERVDAIKSKCETFKSKLRKKEDEMATLTSKSDPRKKNSMTYQFYCDLPDNYEELKGFLNDYAARLDCMEDVNSEILREHENKLQEIKAIESEIQGVLEDNQDYVAKIRTIYDSWFPTVDQVIGTINKHFSDFMRSMGYVGEVRLTRKDTYDFGSFGIEILVQYRQNVPLQALNRHVQSGGERAVAIAAFTLSMQHISHVPFRCVDEINQGMDARNERKIFDMLVDETTKTGSSQYFFVTPKLLRNLKSHKRASVHLVFNGCKIESKDAFIFVMPS